MDKSLSSSLNSFIERLDSVAKPASKDDLRAIDGLFSEIETFVNVHSTLESMNNVMSAQKQAQERLDELSKKL
jgi:hypothetical protein